MSDNEDDDVMEKEEEVEVEANITNPEVVDKYKASAKLVNSTLEFLIPLVVPGAKINDLCTAGDNKIEELTGTVYRQGKLEKGIAHPTTISVNNIISNFSPYVSEGDIPIREGDVVKIELGAHIDGLVAIGGHTVIATNNPQEPTTGRKSDVICAAHYAGECALRLLKTGTKASQITKTIAQVAQIFRCNPVEGTVSHSCKRFDIEAGKVIPNKFNLEDSAQDAVIEDNEVYTINIVLSTGEGKPKEGDAKTTVYKRNFQNIYSLKMKTARALFKQINSKYPSLPFSLRHFDEKQSKLGIIECVKHGLYTPYPVLYEKEGEFVAQFKFTVLLLPGGIQKLVAAPLPYVTSEYSITDPAISDILNKGLKTKKKKKKKKKNNNNTPAASEMAVESNDQ